MKSITIELPADTPVMSLIDFAAQIQCDLRLVEHNRFRFVKTRATSASNTQPRSGNINRLPRPHVGEEIHVNLTDGVYTLPLQPSGMESPRFVVHVPASDKGGHA